MHTSQLKKRIRYLFILFFFLYPLHASPLEMTNSNFGNPFIIYHTPALITRQTGAPIGFSYYYNAPLKEYILSAGFVETFQRSGFALCYLKKNHEIFDKVSTAFSTLYKNISFGATFHFVFSGSVPLFTMDAGGVYQFNDAVYAGMIVKNIFESDTSVESLCRELSVCAGGEVPRAQSLFYAVKGACRIYDFSEREFGFGADMHVQKFFFENPRLSIYAKGALLYNREKKAELSAEACGGLHLFLKTFLLGVFGGYEYVSPQQDGRVSVSLYVNPLYKRSAPDLSCDIELSPQTFSPDGDGKEDVLIIAQKGIFSAKNVQTKRWTLVIKKQQKNKEIIIKNFSGGDMPPSSIVWDGRDTNDRLVGNGEYLVQLFLVDTQGRVVSSSVKKVVVE